MRKILLVEDDPIIRNAVSSDLSDEGYAVTSAPTLTSGRKALAANTFDLIILDVTLPDGTGFDLCREARADRPQIPILLISAHVDEESAIRGLSIGATDYIRKPFGRKELLLRIRRFLENRGGRHELGKLVINLDEIRVTYDGKPIPLTPREFSILAILMKKPGEAVSREALLQSIDEEGNMFDRTLNSHLSRVRSKLKAAGAEEIQIVPVYGVGYRLEMKP